MMMAALRPYQVEAVENIRAALRRGRRRVLLTLPTGAGKTLTAASMIAGALARGKRSLFVAHRKELIDQTVAAFARLGITSVGVIRASDPRRDSSQPIQVASVQTLARRKQDDFDLVFVDEAHRSPARTYAEHVFERHAKAVIVGLSATPVRQDNKPLGAQFDELVVGARYSDLIAAGYLAAPLVYSTPLLPDLGTVRTSGGDFNAEDLEAAVNRGSLIGDLYTQWAKHPPARTVAFAVSVAHSRAIVERFAAEGVRAEHLDGTTPEDERVAILARLASGETTLVSNVGVLCEGWDLPSCKRLIVARPTRSLGLWLQMAGRILRPHDGQRPIILDHGGNWDRHGAPHMDREWSLDAKPQGAPGVAPSRVCPECFAHILASAKVCPLCGAEQPIAEKPPVAPMHEVDLALRALVAVEGLEGEPERLERFRELYRIARERGWMAGAVVHRYRETIGEEPPASWVAALKSDYRNDGVWKTAVAQKRRERREAANAQTHCAGGCGAEMTAAARSEDRVRDRDGRPWRCPRCCVTPERRAENAERQRARNLALTPEQRAENGRKGAAALTPEQRLESAQRASATLSAAMTPERRLALSELACSRAAAMTPEQRLESTRHARAAMTPEQRLESTQKAGRASSVARAARAARRSA